MYYNMDIKKHHRDHKIYVSAAIVYLIIHCIYCISLLWFLTESNVDKRPRFDPSCFFVWQ